MTKEECFETLKLSSNGKCPGSDGFKVEFYLHFWSILGEEMVQSFNQALIYGHLNITQRQGIIKVVPKKRKNKLYLENWRPISLLNIDYKIETKTIAGRISKVLPKLIHEDQTGYVKGRNIGQNIRLVKDIMKITALENIPGMAIFIDFKKAFDSVDWNFLANVLEAFNFGPQIRKWIKTFYTNISSCVINNGHASEFFNLQRGVRQGCPLSGILFVLCAEILAQAIRNNNNIKGIQIYNKEYKISQYADDTTAFVPDATSAENLFETLRIFRNVSGLELNKSKTEGMWLGSCRYSTSTPFGIVWPSEPIYALGIYFTYNEHISFKKNFEEKLNSIKKLLNLWRPRNLTLYGRITILKSLALSKLVYNTSVLTFPLEFASLVKAVISENVWNTKPKIKHTTMIGPKIKGGLDLPDFEIVNNVLKVTWIKRLHESSGNASWSHIPLSFLKEVGGSFLLERNYDLKCLKVSIPIKCYKDILYTWQTINQHTPENKEQILNEILWNNRFVKIEKFSVYYQSWHKAGVIRVKDIFCEKSFLTFNDFCQKFTIKTNFLTYYGLCNSIPQKWIRLLKQSNQNIPTNSEHVGKIPLSKLSCKSASRFLISQKFEPPTAERRMLQANLDEQAISTIYSIPFKVTKDIRLAIFQFKIVHHILATNATLFREKIIQHDKCHLCDQKQTLNHLFVSCPDVQAFWQSFSRWWNVKNDDFIVLNDETIINGFTNDFSQQLGLNLCLIIAKYYIYCASRDGEKYYFEAFLAYLKSKLSIEKSKCKSQIIL